MPSAHPKNLVVLRFCALRRSVPKTNSGAPSILKRLTPKRFLGWLRYCNKAYFCDCCHNVGHFLWWKTVAQRSILFGMGQLPDVRSTVSSFIFEQLKLIYSTSEKF